MTPALNVAKRLGRMTPASTALFVCDIQERFRGAIHEMPTTIHGSNTMVSLAKLMKLPIIVTTQYQEKLGDTVSEITSNLEGAPNVQIVDKTLFSMLTGDVTHLLDQLKPKSILLCGIESHVCVLQTCLDLLAQGYDVHVISDAVSSSSKYNREMALERMRSAGAYISTVEMAIFQLAQDASHPKFKTVSSLIKEFQKEKNGFDV